MRNKNGYGSVVKLSGKRRKQYWVRKTTGFNEKGHPVYQTIGYTETKEEGILLLAQFNNEPWNVDGRKVTLEELFELWKEKKAVKLGKSNQGSLKSAYNHIKKYADMKYTDIKSFHMQDTIDNCGKSYSTQAVIKNLWRNLDKLALEMDFVTKTYSELITSEVIPPTSRTPFTDAEIDQLWKLYEEGIDDVDSVLMLIYSGFRIRELLNIKVSDIDLEQGTFKGGVKTKAGKDRIVPIHSLIRPMVEKRIAAGNEYLLYNKFGNKLFYENYRLKWDAVMKHLNIKKTPHECRHTFESKLDSAGANRKCIDLMMGHVSKDTGNRIYNHKTIEELKEAIELVTR